MHEAHLSWVTCRLLIAQDFKFWTHLSWIICLLLIACRTRIVFGVSALFCKAAYAS